MSTTPTERHFAITPDPMNNPKDMLVSKELERNGVFKGADGLSGLANADAFWEGQPYGTRLYFGDGVADYLHRDVLRAALRSLAELTKLRSERDELVGALEGIMELRYSSRLDQALDEAAEVLAKHKPE
jgi:hypothetical protein